MTTSKQNLIDTCKIMEGKKHGFMYCLYCHNGIKKATFNKLPNGYMTMQIKQYNAARNIWEYISSQNFDFLDTLYRELDMQPIKPISIFRASRKHNFITT